MKYSKYTEEKLYELSPDEIRTEIERLRGLKNIETNDEQATKILLNSVYGATGSPYFIAHNARVAEAVTLQGQDTIKYAMKAADTYFKKYWTKDTVLHEKLGVSKPCSLKMPVVIYGDTDSAYLQFDEVAKSCGLDSASSEFIIGMYQHRLKGFFQQCMDKYAKRYGVENLHEFELESISTSAILLKPKMYVLDMTWRDPGITNDPGNSITAKGVSLVRTEIPPFAREKMKELIIYILGSKEEFAFNEYVRRLRVISREWIKLSVEEMCKSSSLGDYNKWVVNDVTDVTVLTKTPYHVKAAANHNYYIVSAGLKGKYRLLRTGDKVKLYATKKSYDDWFAFAPGEFPLEADPPEIDIDAQFFKVLVDPLNKFIKALGYKELPASLTMSRDLLETY